MSSIPPTSQGVGDCAPGNGKLFPVRLISPEAADPNRFGLGVGRRRKRGVAADATCFGGESYEASPETVKTRGQPRRAAGFLGTIHALATDDIAADG